MPPHLTVAHLSCPVPTALSASFGKKVRFNVKDFGAVGDDMTDKILALEACRDAALAVGGRMSSLPAGTGSLAPSTLGARTRSPRQSA
jgi:hypothetical protein